MTTSTSTGNERYSASMNVDNARTFSWIIADFLDVLTRESDLEFEFQSNGDCTWKIKIEKYVPFVQLKVKLIKPTSTVYASLSVCLLDCEMNRKNERNETCFFNNEKLLLIPKFLSVKELSQCSQSLLHKGDLLLLGTLVVFHDKIKLDTISVPVIKNHYRQNMEQLMKHSTFSDFTIKVHKKEFHCHKVVLSSRCSYFDSLFRSNMRETRNDLLILEDIEPDVLEQVLMYIYTNALEITESNVVSLLRAAEKYILSDLKAECEEKLHEYLSFDNFLDINSIADRFQLHSLKLRLLIMYTVFMKQLGTCDTLSKSSSLSANGEHSVTSNYTNPPCFEDCNFELQSVQQNRAFPSATTWIASCCKNILDRKLNLTPTSSISKILFEKETVNISFSLRYKFRYTHSPGSLYELCLYLTIEAFKEGKICARFFISLIDTSETERQICNHYYEFVVGSERQIYNRYFTEEETKDFSHGQDIMIKLKIWVNECFVYNCVSGRKYIGMDLTAMCENARFTDTVFKVCDEEFQCHKAIVSYHSPVLAQMIERNGNGGVIELVDIKPDDFQKLLTYMYMEKYELNETEALKFLPLAYQYKLEHLKSMCEKVLMQTLSLENAVERLSLAVTCSASTLQKYSLYHVRRFLPRILNIPESLIKLQENGLCRAICDHENYTSVDKVSL